MSRGMRRWQSGKHCIFNLGYHLIWCPKYRKSVLVDGADVRLKGLIEEISKEYDISIASIEIMPDHVHLFVKCQPTHSPHNVVKLIKGKTSKILRDEFPWLRSKIPTLWTNSYYCESVGSVSEEAIRKYIENQKNT